MQDYYRLKVNGETVFETEHISEAIAKAWVIVREGVPVSQVDILARNTTGLYVSIWGSECQEVDR